MALQLERYPLTPNKDELMNMIVATMEPFFRNRLHAHFRLEISAILSGQGECRVNGEVFPIGPGDVLIFNNYELHSIDNTGEEPMVNVALEFDPRFVWGNPALLSSHAFTDVFFNRKPGLQNKLDRSNPAYAFIWYQIEEIRQAFLCHPPHYESVIHARLLSLLAEIVQHYDIVNIRPRAHSRRTADMERVLNYIAEHYVEPISLATLADLLHINKTYFSRIFRESNGISPKEYIVKTRIAAASDMLKNSDRDILEIAESCGYSSLSNFYRAFQRVTGMSPAKFRQSAGE